MLTLKCHLLLVIRLRNLSTFCGWCKSVYIAIKDQKKIWWKKSFHENFWPKFDIFLRSSQEFWNHWDSFHMLITVWHTTLEAFHIIWMVQNMRALNKGQEKIFVEKQIFIEISDPNLTFPTQSMWEDLTTCQLWVSKNFSETFYQKSASTVLSGLIWETD